ncbi:9951_t:CDS:2, partial [Racocetra fulgida]
METINTKQDDKDDSQDGALVLWKYNNPFSNYKRDPERIFAFNGFTRTLNDIEHTKFNIKQNVEYVMSQQQNQFEYDRGKGGLDLLDKDNIQAHVLDWRSLPTTEDTTNPLHKSNIQPFDIILASEILYLPDLHKDLVKTIRYFSHSKPINDQEASSETEMKSENDMKCETRVLGIYKQRGLGEEQFFKIAQIFGKLRVEW